MKRILLLTSAFIIVSLSTSVAAADADWRALVAAAYDRSDLVLTGVVQSVDDQTEVDGGYVYSLQLTGQQKGAPRDQVSMRAGGFFYVVPLEVGDSVLVFLKSTGRGSVPVSGPAYSLVEAEGLRPMVFRLSGARAEPVDNRLGPEFAGVTAADLNGLLSSIEP